MLGYYVILPYAIIKYSKLFHLMLLQVLILL
jgi:hypothetical protein